MGAAIHLKTEKEILLVIPFDQDQGLVQETVQVYLRHKEIACTTSVTRRKISRNSYRDRYEKCLEAVAAESVNLHLEDLGKKLAAADDPKSVLACKQYHRSTITCVRIGNNTSQANENTVSIFSTSEDTTMKLFEYNARNGWTQRRSIRLSSLSLSSCCEITVENNKLPVVVAGSWDNNIYVYSVEMGLMIQQLNDAHDDAVSCLITNDSNSKYMCSGSWDSTVKVWELIPRGINPTPVYTAYDHDAEVNCVAMHGNIFVSGGNDGTLAVNDLEDGDGSPALALFESEVQFRRENLFQK